MSDGDHGHGTALKVGAGTQTTTVTTIGNITSIGGPTMTKETIDISTMDSTLKWREFIEGMLDAGEIPFDINYDGAAAGTANDLDTLFRSTATDLYWRITFPDTSEFLSNGFMTSLGHAIPFDDKITQSLAIKLSGQPTFTDVA
jgi:predicted secreted protein